MSKVAMMVIGKVQSGKRDALKALFDEHLAPAARSNPAQEVVVWCADGADPDRFFLFEIYADAASMQANAGNPAFAAYMGKAMALLAEPPQMATGTPGFTKV